MMTMMMMQRIIESTVPEKSGKPESPSVYLQDDEKCISETDEEELNVDVETDDAALCPVDLTRRQQQHHHDEHSGGNTKTESVCSDDVSRSVSPREQSPSVVVPHQNRRLAFSVENILDPNKFTGRHQTTFNDGLCCWKPHTESLGSPEYDGSETGRCDGSFFSYFIVE